MQPEGSVRASGRLVVITGLPGSGKTTLAKELATSMSAVRMCPGDWMMASGIDLWDEVVRSRIEQFQLTLALDLLRGGNNVVIEWGVWVREEWSRIYQPPTGEEMATYDPPDDDV